MVTLASTPPSAALPPMEPVFAALGPHALLAVLAAVVAVVAACIASGLRMHARTAVPTLRLLNDAHRTTARRAA